MSSAHTPEEPPVERTARLDATEVRDVLALARAAGDTDGADPLSEAVLLHLRHDAAADVVHLMLRDPDGALAGYGHIDAGDPSEGPWAELVVHPLRRRHGLGRRLVTAAVAAATRLDPAGRLRVWAHGDHPSAGALALHLGFARARVLLQLRRPLRLPLPDRPLPTGISLRPFRPGADDAAWLAVNSRAFATHPEQGRWTIDDLRVRMSEPWFDPAGFLLATDDATGRLLGFHWTKVHAGAAESIGEVYVLGVDPDAHGRGLGTALTVAGLRHLHDRGLSQAMLYVDESNTPAVALYGRLGFARWTADVNYRRG
ncbi:mycothiol synthase [Micromonospora pattaloongensis]|nr:mycothiol synthase [Micromonospora pattaloongensis]